MRPFQKTTHSQALLIASLLENYKECSETWSRSWALTRSMKLKLTNLERENCTSASWQRNTERSWSKLSSKGRDLLWRKNNLWSKSGRQRLIKSSKWPEWLPPSRANYCPAKETCSVNMKNWKRGSTAARMKLRMSVIRPTALIHLTGSRGSN